MKCDMANAEKTFFLVFTFETGIILYKICIPLYTFLIFFILWSIIVPQPKRIEIITPYAWNYSLIQDSSRTATLRIIGVFLLLVFAGRIHGRQIQSIEHKFCSYFNLQYVQRKTFLEIVWYMSRQVAGAHIRCKETRSLLVPTFGKHRLTQG